ncbi:CPBP family intramembrane glutamic endopeptidase [Blastomonas fulva]|uniref:CPBP family intramembrane glutamic endopeptidase n=1 Tax=Blastomonas fulva TaxID=1550728 RepID=UPI0025A3C357|nr:CPBP family intramembrane glutamic endopeptidase [Blastomonas fulva]MDM7929796.1 CPBP family intramembrane metalloprotease [Blastomonas fulva]MDM7965662.1 CPBP family intramembrane metalloprotease [Blastomonas fulva]
MTDSSGTTPLWLRIAQIAPIRLAVLGLLLLGCLAFSNTFLEQNKAVPLQAIMAVAGMVALAMWIYVGFARYVERREPADLALGPMPRELGLGLVLGTALYTGSVLILMAIGVMRIEGVNPPAFMLPAIAMALSSGFLEELLFRGALFRIVEQWLGSWISVFVSSVVFGVVHLMNPAATITGAIFISVEAGVLLAAAYMLTRRLWLGIGFHISWNYTQSAVFSGVVSGSVADPGLFKTVMTGPDLLTGGSFGLEASLIACLLCTTAGTILVMRAVRRGQVMQPFWSRTQPEIATSAERSLIEQPPA